MDAFVSLPRRQAPVIALVPEDMGVSFRRVIDQGLGSFAPHNISILYRRNSADAEYLLLAEPYIGPYGDLLVLPGSPSTAKSAVFVARMRSERADVGVLTRQGQQMGVYYFRSGSRFAAFAREIVNRGRPLDYSTLLTEMHVAGLRICNCEVGGAPTPRA